MFSFHCAACDLKMGDFPPLEALSAQQAVAVDGVEDQATKYNMFEGTQWEGLSQANFCGFCVRVIFTYHDAFVGMKVKNMYRGFELPGYLQSQLRVRMSLLAHVRDCGYDLEHEWWSDAHFGLALVEQFCSEGRCVESHLVAEAHCMEMWFCYKHTIVRTTQMDQYMIECWDHPLKCNCKGCIYIICDVGDMLHEGYEEDFESSALWNCPNEHDTYTPEITARFTMLGDTVYYCCECGHQLPTEYQEESDK